MQKGQDINVILWSICLWYLFTPSLIWFVIPQGPLSGGSVTQGANVREKNKKEGRCKNFYHWVVIDNTSI